MWFLGKADARVTFATVPLVMLVCVMEQAALARRPHHPLGVKGRDGTRCTVRRMSTGRVQSNSAPATASCADNRPCKMVA
jgi:hypothetical protein